MIKKLILTTTLSAFVLLGHSSAAERFAARNISAGEILSAGDLVGPDEELVSIDTMLGLEAKRSFYKGAPVMMAALRPPVLVKRNAIVVMEYRSGPLIIRTEGRALEEGADGDYIRVMNLGSRATVSARVNSSGGVEVGR